MVILMSKYLYLFRFLLVNIGQLDVSVMMEPSLMPDLAKYLKQKRMSLRDPCPLPDTNGPSLPFVKVSDEAFPLKEYLLRPYPG